MKIGLDVHGVMDKHSVFFKTITKLLVEHDHEVHVITGLTKNDYIALKWTKYITHTHFYSITDDLYIRFNYELDIHNRPRFEEYAWNTAKAEYCRKNKIDIMFDDSDIYGKYFWTPYFQTRRIDEF